ncbi:dihydroneopterin aldolase [Mongoliitalea daihaiensis]|uniref:dihydroneopterin aldolase n=1 Tax=Mongoliitalea daihaiensis TaxID=2782006 RepID=UPI001F3076C1|nr:dihydroneopterin aldolase [Mongoliitalea daihaiensis]UJP64685.1 dihydroneopterin aldolase [Mongoliitalea daihaiensis]
MGTVRLEGASFYAYHGVYPEEKVLGNQFLVDIELTYSFRKAMEEDALEGTVDYGELYAITSKHMQTPVKLLEHLAHLIIEETLQMYPESQRIAVTIKKQQPAVGGLVAYSSVTVNYPEDYD